MHAVIRTYTGAGAKKLFAEFEKRKPEIEALIREVKGLVSYTLINTGDGGASVTVCRDKKGAEESVRVAGEWIKKNMSKLEASPPTIKEGPVVVRVE